jgi:hypothetical protein
MFWISINTDRFWIFISVDTTPSSINTDIFWIPSMSMKIDEYQREYIWNPIGVDVFWIFIRISKIWIYVSVDEYWMNISVNEFKFISSQIPLTLTNTRIPIYCHEYRSKILPLLIQFQRHWYRQSSQTFPCW